MCKETAENGVLLKEYRCEHASQVNYDKTSDSNKLKDAYSMNLFISKVT